MKFVSTRHAAPAASLSQALAAGLAPDGGLYVPDHRPQLQSWSAQGSFAQTAAAVLAP
jgi:threonine synthase